MPEMPDYIGVEIVALSKSLREKDETIKVLIVRIAELLGEVEDLKELLANAGDEG